MLEAGMGNTPEQSILMLCIHSFLGAFDGLDKVDKLHLESNDMSVFAEKSGQYFIFCHVYGIVAQAFYLKVGWGDK